MSKCNKAKNPCKICLGQVSQKNGLRCQGACQSWVHYGCLNYTPGKIKDIKAGIIKVTCPCPDCKTTMPKEYRTDQPYSCNNSACPAHEPPRCDNIMCPLNDPTKGGPPMAHGPPCPLNKCGNDCKQYSSPQLPDSSRPATGHPCVPGPPTRRGGYGMSPMSSSDACLTGNNKCASGCSSASDIPGDMGNQHMGGSMPSFNVVEQMCNTVGQLTNQINELMSQMKQAMTESGYRQPIPARPKVLPQKGPRSMCPKPCHCPGNPAQRK